MSKVKFLAMPTDQARAYQSGAPDAYGRPPERRVSDGSGVPCRHCLTDVSAGEDYLILAHRPFPDLQPYAETGPVFLHAAACGRHPESSDIPALYLEREQLLMRGYGADNRILYGTGQVVPTDAVAERAAELFQRPEVAFLHLRSVADNCFHCRVERG